MGFQSLEDFSSRALARKGGDFLTKEEETALWQTWFESTDEKARQKARETILVKHLPLCKKAAEQWARKNRLSADDFFGEAYTEMTAAFERFDPAAGARFSTFIEQRLQGALRNAAVSSGQIKVATTRRSMHLFSNWGDLNRAALRNDPGLSDHQRHQAISELVRAHDPEEFKNISTDEVAMFEVRLSHRFVQLDKPINDSEADSVTAQVFLAAEWGDATQGLEQDDMDRTKLLLRKVVDSPKLNDRERTVIKQRHLVDEEKTRTLKDLAQEFGVSIERVRQIEEEGLRKVKQAMKWQPLPVRTM